MRLFHVRAAELTSVTRDFEPGFQFEYRFVRTDRGDGFSAWEAEGSEGGLCIDVLDSSRACSGGYRQFALNRIVTRELVRYQPDLLVLEGLYGCTIDLPRVAAVLGIPCVWLIAADGQTLDPPDANVAAVIGHSMEACRAVFADTTGLAWLSQVVTAEQSQAVKAVEEWAAYFSGIGSALAGVEAKPITPHPMLDRDPTLLTRMQVHDVAHFSGAGPVLDVGCGVGTFLDLLRQENIEAEGIERDPVVAAYGQGMGLSIAVSDALAFLRNTTRRYAGMYCSHFVEHLPVEAVEELLGLMAARLERDGVLVLVFPDPESIRTQLLGFWRDPEHVRLYHPELVTALASQAGFDLDWSSYEAQPHPVVGFPERAPDVPGVSPVGFQQVAARGGETLLDKLLAAIGLSSARRVRGLTEAMAEQVEHTAAALGALERRTDLLWSVNQTWAWNDNVTLRLRKRGGEV